VPIIEEQEPVAIDAPARAPWQTPHVIIAEFEETQGLLGHGGDWGSSHS